MEYEGTNNEFDSKNFKRTIKDEDSVYPAERHLTFNCYIYMVPQYKPESVLMLGFGGGTTAGLIRKIYGDVPITGVDTKPCEPVYGVEFIQADAEEFMKTCGHFDTIILDIFESDKWDNPPFLNDKEFVSNLVKKGNYIIVNTLKNLDMSEYRRQATKVGINSPSGVANKIYYFRTTDIPHLNPFPDRI